MATPDTHHPDGLHRFDEAGKPREGQYPYPYPYANSPKYDPATALAQGTLLPWLDDHWRRTVGRGEETPQ